MVRAKSKERRTAARAVCNEQVVNCTAVRAVCYERGKVPPRVDLYFGARQMLRALHCGARQGWEYCTAVRAIRYEQVVNRSAVRAKWKTALQCKPPWPAPAG